MDTQPNNKVSVAIFVGTLTVVVVPFKRVVMQYIIVAIIGNGHLKKMGKILMNPRCWVICTLCVKYAFKSLSGYGY
jgi:Na+/H+-dicarboxylate symporter